MPRLITPAPSPPAEPFPFCEGSDREVAGDLTTPVVRVGGSCLHALLVVAIWPERSPIAAKNADQ